MIDVESLRRDIREFDLDVSRLVQCLEEIVPAYEADRIELQQWRRRKAHAHAVRTVSDRLKASLDAWHKLPDGVRHKIEESRRTPVDASFRSLIEDLEFFAEIHQEVKGNPGLATDDGAIEIGPLEWLIVELAKHWPEDRFDHSAVISRQEKIADPTGRFLRFIDAVAKSALDPRPSVPTLSALIRKIKPKLAALKTT